MFGLVFILDFFFLFVAFDYHETLSPSQPMAARSHGVSPQPSRTLFIFPPVLLLAEPSFFIPGTPARATERTGLPARFDSLNSFCHFGRAAFPPRSLFLLFFIMRLAFSPNVSVALGQFHHTPPPVLLWIPFPLFMALVYACSFIPF